MCAILKSPPYLYHSRPDDTGTQKKLLQLYLFECECILRVLCVFINTLFKCFWWCKCRCRRCSRLRRRYRRKTRNDKCVHIFCLKIQFIIVTRTNTHTKNTAQHRAHTITYIHTHVQPFIKWTKRIFIETHLHELARTHAHTQTHPIERNTQTQALHSATERSTARKSTSEIEAVLRIFKLWRWWQHV